jgi:hypothetical protein
VHVVVLRNRAKHFQLAQGKTQGHG